MSRTLLLFALLIGAGAWIAQSGAARAALVGHWTFDNPADSYADSSGYANNGVKEGTGTLTQVTGQVGVGALQFDGAARLNVGSGSVFDTQSYTVSAWVYKDPAAGTSWRGAAGDWNAGWMHLGQHSSGTFSNHVRVDGAQKDMIGTSAVKSQQWQHIVSVVDKANMRLQLWVDGVLESNTTLATWGSTGMPGTTNVLIGTPYAVGTYSWMGRIDDVAIWNRALTAPEIGTVRSAAIQGTDAGAALARSPASGLLSYYPFEGNAADMAQHYSNSSSTHDDDFAAVGSVSFATGQVGMAAKLSGGYFVAPNVAVDDINLPSTFTIEAWINPDTITSGFQRIVLNWGSAGQRGYHLGLYGNDVNLYLSADGSGQYEVATGGDVVAGQWQHIAAVSDGTNVMLYLNGQEVDRGALSGGALFQTTTEGLGLGDSASAPSSGAHFTGLVDELAFWNVALTPEQIDEHFLAGTVGYGLSVPEPATWLLLVLGGLTLAAWRWNRGRVC